MIREFKRWMIYTWTGKTDDGGNAERKRVIGDVKTVSNFCEISQEIFLKRFRRDPAGTGPGSPAGYDTGRMAAPAFASARSFRKGIEYVVGARRLNAMAY
jgi:hypothetical protein